jgi:hypothetical protein
MKMSEAIGLCPNALVLPTDLPHYERLFGSVLDLLETFSPAVEATDTGTAFLAMDGLAATPAAIADDIIRVVHSRFGLMGAVGIAAGKFCALTAARETRPGSVKLIAPGEEASFLERMPMGKLPASEAMRWRLAMLGLTTIGEVARLPLGAVQAQFGGEGKHCWELAQGVDNEPLQPRLTEETVTRRIQLPAAALTLDAILMATEKLVHAAYAPLGGNRWVRKAIIRAALEEGAWETSVAFREALSRPEDAWFAIKQGILRRPPERPVEEIEIELIGLSGESGKQAVMFDSKGKLWQQVEEAMHQLESQLPDGEEHAPIGKIVPLEPDSRIPERRAVLTDFADRFAT